MCLASAVSVRVRQAENLNKTQVGNDLGGLGKYRKRLKETGVISGKEKRTTKTRKQYLYHIRIKHFCLLKGSEDSQQGVTDGV